MAGLSCLDFGFDVLYFDKKVLTFMLELLFLNFLFPCFWQNMINLFLHDLFFSDISKLLKYWFLLLNLLIQALIPILLPLQQFVHIIKMLFMRSYQVFIFQCFWFNSLFEVLFLIWYFLKQLWYFWIFTIQLLVLTFNRLNFVL